MKKFFYAFLALILVLFIATYSILFTAFGNDIITHLAHNKIKQDYGLDVRISRFSLRPTSLDLEAFLNELMKIELNGELSLFRLGFDLDYALKFNENHAQNSHFKPNQKIHFLGKIQGNFNDFIANGEGLLFGSNINLESKIYHLSPISLNLNAQNIDLEEILNFLNQAPYFKGKIDLVAKITAKDLKPYGSAIIKLDINNINYKQIQKDFALKLPQNSDLNSEILATIKGDQIFATSETHTSYLSLKSKKTLYDLTQNLVHTDFKLDIPKLNKIEELTSMPFNGSLAMMGDLIFSKNNLRLLDTSIELLGGKVQLSGNYDFNKAQFKLATQALIKDLSQLESLSRQKLQGRLSWNSQMQFTGSKIDSFEVNADLAGGKILAHLQGENLELNIDKLDLQKALFIAGMPPYASGIIDARAKLSSLDFKKLNGNIHLSAKGFLYAPTLSQLLRKPFPPQVDYELKLKSTLKDSLADFDALLHSSMGKFKDFKGSFDLNQLILNSYFNLSLNDFSKFGFLVDRKLSGSADFNGMLSFDKGLNLSINSANLFQGRFAARVKDHAIDASLDGMNLSTLAKSIDLIDLYEGKGNAKVHYHFLNQNGTVFIDMSEGRLKKNAITNAIKLLTLKDLTDDVFHSAKVEAKIHKELIDFMLHMQAKNAQVSANKAKINIENKLLNIPFEAQFDKLNFKGIIEGTSDDPRIKLSGESIKNTLKNIIDDGVKKPSEKAGEKLDKFFKQIF